MSASNPDIYEWARIRLETIEQQLPLLRREREGILQLLKDEPEKHDETPFKPTPRLHRRRH